MTSRSSGGLIKFSIALPERLLRDVERIAANEPGMKRNGAIIALLTRGVESYDRDQEILRRHRAESQQDAASSGAA
ncbi:MAG: hypothetical protein ACM3US_07395 [Sphingomonadaceae bacterium]